MEVSLGSVSFPTIKLPVDSYVYQYLQQENEDIIREYQLQPFEMTLQSLERTFADKVFAICDYYISGKIQRNSRHIYDLYMLLPRIDLTEEYKELVSEIRLHRAKLSICPSAQEGVVISEILEKIIKDEVYRSDYEAITIYFQHHTVGYKEAISAIRTIIASDVF